MDDNYWTDFAPRDEIFGDWTVVRDCFATGPAIDLYNQWRKLWTQHVYWTRMTILSIAAAAGDLEATTKRLLRNATDFAKLFLPFYGPQIAGEFERLVTDHLVIAAELVKAAKAGNKEAAEQAERKWYDNADAIVRFLNCINPCWSLEGMRAMWHKHLALTKDEAVARLGQKFPRDIAVFGKIENQALTMADEFSAGMIRQFPERFRD